MISYRNAVPSDVLDLIGLVQEYCEEERIPQDLPSIKKYIDMQLGKLPTIVAVDKDVVVGVISFIVIPSPFKLDYLIGKKIACFVSKSYRDQDIGYKLIETAETITKNQGASKFFFSSNKEVKGYDVFETEYVKDI